MIISSLATPYKVPSQAPLEIPNIFFSLIFEYKYFVFKLFFLIFQSAKNYGWASGGSSILSEFGTLHMEFAYLSDVTGNPAYKNAVERVRTAVQNAARPRKLYPNYLNPKTGKQ